MSREFKTRFHRQRGQALLETAIMIVVIFTLFFWIFDLSWLMYSYSVLGDAANEGVRYSIVHSGGDVSGTQARVAAFASGSIQNVAGISTSVTFPDGSPEPPNRVLVTVTYTFVPYLSSLIATPTIKAYAEGRRVVE